MLELRPALGLRLALDLQLADKNGSGGENRPKTRERGRKSAEKTGARAKIGRKNGSEGVTLLLEAPDLAELPNESGAQICGSDYLYITT